MPIKDAEELCSFLDNFRKSRIIYKNDFGKLDGLYEFLKKGVIRYWDDAACSDTEAAIESQNEERIARDHDYCSVGESCDY